MVLAKVVELSGLYSRPRRREHVKLRSGVSCRSPRNDKL